jgi:hypothetical protein
MKLKIMKWNGQIYIIKRKWITDIKKEKQTMVTYLLLHRS